MNMDRQPRITESEEKQKNEKTNNKNNQRQSTDEAQRVKMQTTENYSQALISSGGTQLAFEITWVL